MIYWKGPPSFGSLSMIVSDNELFGQYFSRPQSVPLDVTIHGLERGDERALANILEVCSICNYIIATSLGSIIIRFHKLQVVGFAGKQHVAKSGSSSKLLVNGDASSGPIPIVRHCAGPLRHAKKLHIAWPAKNSSSSPSIIKLRLFVTLQSSVIWNKAIFRLLEFSNTNHVERRIRPSGSKQ